MARYMMWIVALIACRPPVALAQGSTCLATGADTLSRYVLTVRRMIGQADSATMNSRGVPWAPVSQIFATTDEQVCAEAASAYNRETGNTGGITQLYVVRIGDKGYSVINPAEIAGEYQTYWIFDQAWHRIGLPVNK